MSRRTQKQHYFFSVLALLQIGMLMFMPYGAEALLGSAKPKIPDPRTEIRKFLEEDLNVSVDELSDLTENINFTDLKGELPRITLTFDNPHPKDGEIVTATASTNALKNPEQSYFTWYIRNENDDAGSLEQYKIDAIHRHAAVYFDPLRFDEPFNGGNGDGIVSRDEYPEVDLNTDGHRAVVGGTTARGKANFCYIHDRQTGEQLELVGSSEGDPEIFNCPNGRPPVCLSEDFSEQCPVLIEAVKGDITLSSSASSSAGASAGVSTVNSTASALIDGGEDSPRTAPLARCIIGGIGRCTSEGVVCATPGAVPYCAPENTALATAQINQDTCPTPVLYEELTEGFYATFEGGCQGAAGLSGYYEATCDYRDITDFQRGGAPYGPETCGPDIHLFPGGPATGDGNFLVDEEFDWRLDPTTANTTPHGLDEEFVTGFGVTQFKWRYREGDEVGVVAEGLGTNPAKHDNSSEQVVFLFVSGCDLPRGGRSSYLADIGGGKQGLVKTINMGRPELDLCIMEERSGDFVNFVEPGESERSDLEVEIIGGDPNFTLQNNVGHIFSVEGNIVNKGDDSDAGESQASYRWAFACHPDRAVLETPTNAGSGSVAGGVPINVTQYLVDQARLEEAIGNELPFENIRQVGEQTAIEGSNLTKIAIPLNLPDGCFAGSQTHMRVRLIVNEPGVAPNQTNFGRRDLIYKVSNDPAVIQAHLTTITEVGGGRVEAARAGEICAAPTAGGTSLDYALCRVVSGEIIGLHIPGLGGEENVQWSVDGEDVFCTASAQCNRAQDTIFIPILGDSEELISINATINDPTQPEDVIALNRILRIVDPEIRIVPGEGTQFKELGSYIDIEGNSNVPPTLSDVVVEFSNSVNLEVETIPPFVERDIAANGGFRWEVNGEENAITNEGAFSFTPQPVEGVRTAATVKVTGELNIPREDRVYLKRQFGVSQFNTGQRLLQAEVKAQEIEGVAAARLNGTNDTFFANVLASAPQYFLFLLKIVLIIAIMLFSSAVILSLGTRRS